MDVHSALKEEIDTLRNRYRSEADPTGLAFASLADAYRRAGWMEEAWSLLEEGLEDHPDFATGHLVAARVLRDRGEREASSERYERVLELDPENTEALREASALAQHDGRIRAALALCQRLALLDPGDPELRARIRTLKEVHFQPGPREEPGEPEEAREFEPHEEIQRPGELETGSAEAREDQGADEPDEPRSRTEGEEFVEGVPAIGESWTGDTWASEPWTPETKPGPERAEAPTPGPAEEPEDEKESAEAEAEPEGTRAGESEVYTRTMADLYARQGHVERALKIYGHLLDRDPGDESLRDRIRELEEEESTESSENPISEYFDALLSWEHDTEKGAMREQAKEGGA